MSSGARIACAGLTNGIASSSNISVKAAASPCQVVFFIGFYLFITTIKMGQIPVRGECSLYHFNLLPNPV